MCGANWTAPECPLNVLSAQFDGALLSSCMLFLFVLPLLLTTDLK